MNSFSILKSRQLGLFAVVGALLLALILPSIVSGAQLTARSVELSSSAKSATGVTYRFNFTPVANAAAFVVNFCANSPLVGEACTAPTGFSATGATGTGVVARDVNTLVITKSLVGGTPAVQVVDNIINPSAAGPMYARIISYNTASNANGYIANQTSGTDVNNRIDDGGAAISITNSVAVSGAVLESLSFCVSGSTIGDNCASGVTAPTLRLGETVGSTVALVPGTVSTGSIYTQISTNAVNGAVVSLKTGANCGGLKRAGASTCDIAPALASDILANSATAKFGVKTNAATNGTGGSGTYQPYNAAAYYSPTVFKLAYAADNLTGVTSPYGDYFLDTAGAPANNKNMQLTFGATVTNQTPAGLYSADLSLIATGKF